MGEKRRDERVGMLRPTDQILFGHCERFVFSVGPSGLHLGRRAQMGQRRVQQVHRHSRH